MQPNLGVCRSADLAEGTMRAVEVAGRPILLTRVGGLCHAVSGRCPHAGAPLAQGVLAGNVVICPWHKAAFSVVDGRHLEPPAVDDLQPAAVREADGWILLEPEAIAPHSIAPHAIAPKPIAPESIAPEPIAPEAWPPAADDRCMAIIGAGAAGAVAAQALRTDQGFAGRIVLISHEDQLPYDRTILSKYTLSGRQGGEKSPLQSADFYARHRIERCAREVRRIDPAARLIHFAAGEPLRYDAALLATGSIPRPLDLPGAQLPGVFLLRSFADAAAIVTAAQPARRVVVLGASFIGMEAAAALRERGLDVTVVAPHATPFGRQVGAAVGGALQRLHERHGVRFRLGQSATAIEGEGRVQRVLLQDGSVLPADLVVAGLGVTPATTLLTGVPVRTDGGLDVGPDLLVTKALYAAGDIAAFPLHGDGERIRVEHWRVAQQHGRLAAANLLGAGRIYTAVPYFWTIHYLKRLDYVGHAATWDEVVVDGDLEAPAFVAWYLRDGCVTAAAGLDRDQQMARILDLMTRRRAWPLLELRRASA